VSAYDGAKPEHRNALAQIDESRQRALRAVSEVRKCQINSPHPNLAPAPMDGKSLPVMATQAVGDYLLQLRPYRANSKKWHLDFGTIELPKSINGDNPRRQSRDPELWICQQPEIELKNVSQLIESLNMDVHYSTNKPDNDSSPFDSRLKPSELSASERRMQNQLSELGKVTGIKYQIDPPSYPGTFHVSRETRLSMVEGGITQDEAVEMDMTIEDEQDDEDEDEYIPAVPHVDNAPGDTRGHDGELRTFKFVFGPDRLLRLVETADEVAAEMDLLIDLGTPREQDSGGI